MQTVFLAQRLNLGARFLLLDEAELRRLRAEMMLSRTVNTSTSLKCWCTIPILSAVASLGSFISTFTPFLRISPASGWYRPKGERS